MFGRGVRVLKNTNIEPFPRVACNAGWGCGEGGRLKGVKGVKGGGVRRGKGGGRVQHQHKCIYSPE